MVFKRFVADSFNIRFGSGVGNDGLEMTVRRHFLDFGCEAGKVVG